MKTPLHTIEGLEREIAQAPAQSKTGVRFLNLDTRVIAWLLADARSLSSSERRHVEALQVCKVGFENLTPPTDLTDIGIRDVCLQKIEWALCEDCPPDDYPTDKTRCSPCPRRT